ncbi:hypothetical protein [Nocardioides sp. AE5]|uniref:hypothetical protein n=1 Tax=Nocardioides sp. AE5 TaxID=2962573 RepID=UPI002882A5BD|nr:hypothetical protein [Nocardioides sp. AE5]MDT0202527.1 hypothetical protein [Nocardioides sp. AE5]
MTRRPLASLAVAAVTLLALTGCGDNGGAVAGKPATGTGSTSGTTTNGENPFEGKSDREIQQLILDGMADVDSLRLSGNIVDESGDNVAMVFVLDRGGNCDGSMTLGGARADIKSDGSFSYMRGDRAFWLSIAGDQQAADAVLAALQDRWVRMPADSEDGFNDICDLDLFLEEFAAIEGSSHLEPGEVKQVDGHEAIELVEDNGGGETTTLWVTVEAPHRIVRMSSQGGDEPGEFQLSKYNEPVNVQVPGPGEYVDQDDL